jgi:hypothetical protein
VLNYSETGRESSHVLLHMVMYDNTLHISENCKCFHDKCLRRSKVNLI